MHLAGLALAIMLPLGALVAVTLANHLEAARQGLYQDAQHMADNLVANMEREMTGVMVLLNLLAQDTAFDRGDYAALYTRAKEGLKGRKGYVLLFGARPEPLFSTRFDYGISLPPPVDDGSAARVTHSGTPMLSNLFFGRTAQRLVFIAIVPIMREGTIVGRLHMALEPEHLSDGVIPIGLAPSWSVSLADRDNVYVLSSQPQLYPTGQALPASLIPLMRAASGFFRTQTHEGEPLVMAYRRSSLFGWTGFATLPVAVAERPLLKVWRQFIAIAAAALTLSLLAAYSFSRALAHPIRQLIGAARAFGEGRDTPVMHSGLMEANLLSAAFSGAADQLRRRTAALAESERRFRLFADQTLDAIWFKDGVKPGFAYVSPAFHAIFPAESGINSMAGWRAAVHEDDRALFEAAFDQGAAGGQCEYRIRPPGGALKWVLDIRFMLEGGEGRPPVMAGILRDITTRKEALEGLKAAQAEAEARLEELENLYASAPVGLVLMDTACNVLRMNTTLAATSTHPAGPFKGLSFFDLFPVMAAAARDHCAAVLRSGQAIKNIEMEMRGQDDAGPHYLLAHFYPVRGSDGGVSGIGAILENITERKLTEQARARLAAIVQAASDATFSFAPSGRIQTWNPAAESLFDYSEAEAVGRDIAVLFPQESSKDYRELHAAWQAGDSRRLDTEMRRKDGRSVPVAVSIAPILEGGHVVAISATVEDITERRHSQARQLLMNRELSHRVKNTLAVIQAMARHTLRSTPDPAAFASAFEGRLRALAIAHNLLTSSEWEGADIRELAHEQLAMHLSGASQLHLEGSNVMLPPGIATSLGLVLHELGTNAAKYGALSVPGGSVMVKWRVAPSSPHRTLLVDWTESGGPVVSPPERRGFGSLLIESSGKVEQRFEAGGLHCLIEMPLMEQAGARGF